MGSENNSFSGTLEVRLEATETVAVSAESAVQNTIRHKDFNVGPTVFNSRSATPLELAVYNQVTTTTSGVEIDFTNLTTFNGGEADATGLKLFAIMLESTSTGSAYVTTATSNNYPISYGGGTASSYATTAATLTQDVVGSTSPATSSKYTLTFGSTPAAGFIKLATQSTSLEHSALYVPYAPTAALIATAMSQAVNLNSGGQPLTTAQATAAWSVVESPANTWTITSIGSEANKSHAFTNVETNALLTVSTSTNYGKIPIYASSPTLIKLGTAGDAVSPTKKILRIVADSGTVVVNVGLWFV